MEAPQKASKDENKVSSAQKTTEEKAVSVISDEEEVDDSLIIENDGDLFWVLHRIAWGTIKGLILIGMIVITVWFIWSDDEKSLDTKIQKNIEKVKLPKAKEVIEKNEPKNVVSTASVENYTIKIIEKAYKLDQNRINKVSGILSASIVWLKKAKSLGEISTLVLRIEDPIPRAKKIESTLQEADKALGESVYLQKQLDIQIKELLSKKNKLQVESLKLDNELFEKIIRFNPNDIDGVLSQKIAKEKEIVEVSEAGKIRETLLKNIQSFDYLLRTKWIPLVLPVEMRGQSVNN